jgi:hypothetical protein
MSLFKSIIMGFFLQFLLFEESFIAILLTFCVFLWPLEVHTKSFILFHAIPSHSICTRSRRCYIYTVLWFLPAKLTHSHIISQFFLHFLHLRFFFLRSETKIGRATEGKIVQKFPAKIPWVSHSRSYLLFISVSFTTDGYCWSVIMSRYTLPAESYWL